MAVAQPRSYHACSHGYADGRRAASKLAAIRMADLPWQLRGLGKRRRPKNGVGPALPKNLATTVFVYFI